MRRILLLTGLCLVFLFLLPVAAATSIQSENVSINVQENGAADVEAAVHVTTLTTETFSYFMPYPVQQFQAAVDGEPVPCSRDTQSAGSRFSCDLPRSNNVTVHLRYRTSGLVEDTRTGPRFSYAHNILVPTETYRVQLSLPEGFGLANGDEGTEPEPVSVSSTGRQIVVHWREDPSIGDQARFSASYESLQENRLFSPRIQLFVVAGLALVLLGAVLVIALQRHTGNGEGAVVMQLLQEDEQEIVKYVADQGGECRQNEIVDNVDYSKAKVSTVLSDLADRGVVEKEKTGRTNTVRLLKTVEERS